MTNSVTMRLQNVFQISTTIARIVPGKTFNKKGGAGPLTAETTKALCFDLF